MAVRIRNKFTYTVIILLLSISCATKPTDFEGINMELWRSDRKACNQIRTQSKDAFAAQKDRLLALSETQVVEQLGSPDIQQLSKRNQKFYYYYLEPHGECAMEDSSTRPLRVAIRFNAMGLAKEVRIEKNY